MTLLFPGVKNINKQTIDVFNSYLVPITSIGTVILSIVGNFSYYTTFLLRSSTRSRSSRVWLRGTVLRLVNTLICMLQCLETYQSQKEIWWQKLQSWTEICISHFMGNLDNHGKSRDTGLNPSWVHSFCIKIYSSKIRSFSTLWCFSCTRQWVKHWCWFGGVKG